jgi:phage gp36-like protein
MYVTRAQITGKIPESILNDALDDDGDGVEDEGALDNVIALASAEVEGYLSGLFPVPFPEPAPPKVCSAAFAFTCETIYQRRNVPEDKNPFSKLALWWREHLQKVGNRELPFDSASEKAFTPGAAITEPTSVNSQST